MIEPQQRIERRETCQRTTRPGLGNEDLFEALQFARTGKRIQIANNDRRVVSTTLITQPVRSQQVHGLCETFPLSEAAMGI